MATLSRGIECDACGDSVEHNGPTFRVIENMNGETIAYVCDENCENEWSTIRGF
jgi:hypothetical protein